MIKISEKLKRFGLDDNGCIEDLGGAFIKTYDKDDVCKLLNNFDAYVEYLEKRIAFLEDKLYKGC